MKKINLLTALSAALLLFGCKDDKGPKVPLPHEPTETIGYYVLNEGTQSGGNATLGYYDIATKHFTPDYFGMQNPGDELGDLPNDMTIYGTMAYVTLNGSGEVVVLGAADGKVRKRLAVEGARSLAAHDGKVYVSSYKGEVVRIDTLSLTVTGTAAVNGKYCEGIAVWNDKIYVANNATPEGMQTKGNTVSVIDIPTFTEEAQITTPTNPVGLTVGAGRLYLTTSAVYDDSWTTMLEDARLHRIDPKQNRVDYTFPDVTVSSMAVLGDYLYTVHFSWETYTGSSRKINLATDAVADFLAEAPGNSVYGISANPLTEELFVINSGYTGPGTVDCYNADGTFQYQMTDRAQGPYVSKVVPVNK